MVAATHELVRVDNIDRRICNNQGDIDLKTLLGVIRTVSAKWIITIDCPINH